MPFYPRGSWDSKKPENLPKVINIESHRVSLPHPPSLLQVFSRLGTEPSGAEAAAFPHFPTRWGPYPYLLLVPWTGAQLRLAGRGLLPHWAPSSASWGWKPQRPARPGEGTVCPGSLAHTQG